MTMRAAVSFRAASELEATRPKPTGPHCAWSQRNSPRCCPERTVREHCRFWCIVCDRLYQPGFG
jgi:hypothetical protein